MNDPLQTLTHEAYALAYQLSGKREDAMDILQDAAAKALSHSNVPARQSNDFKPWFFKVVRNRALDQLRRQQRFIHEPIEQDSLCDEVNDNPQQTLEQSQLKEHLDDALMKLKHHQCFNYEQIAQVLDIPKGSVMSRLHRARMALRNLLVNSN